MPASCPPLEGQKDGIDRAGRLGIEGARRPVSETKLSIIAAMKELDCLVTSAELYAMLDGIKSLAVIEYHLCALARTEAIKLVLGPEVLFQLKGAQAR